jgi:uncharacterized protein YcbK (DUF882 family)
MLDLNQLTPHFHLTEFAQPSRHGFPRIAHPWPDLCFILAQNLEKIRTWFLGRPIRIISGYRTPEYNRKIGGARHSQHVVGRAVDFVVRGVPAQQVHAACLRLVREGDLTALGLGEYPNFTHLDIRASGRSARWRGGRTQS